MNILLINHYAGSDKHGMEYRPFYLAREWVRLGHQVTIAAASFSHLRIETPCIHGSVTEENIEGIRYVWLKTPGYSGNGMRRVVNMMMFLMQLLRHRSRLVGNCPPDVVIASSTYPLDIFPAYRIAKKYGAKLIFEVHDLWPLSPVELGIISPWNPFVFLVQRAENFACRNADNVVSLLPKADAHLQHHGMAANKFACVPNGFCAAEWKGSGEPIPQEHANVLEKLREQDRFILGYAGGHGKTNALEVLIEVAQRLQTSPITLVLVGKGSVKQELQAKAIQHNLTNIVFLPSVQKTAIPALLDSMDALYIGWNRVPVYRFGISPNKLLDYMMSAKPIIHAVEAGNDPVAECGCGISCTPEDAASVAEAVSQLMSKTPVELDAIGRRGREYVMSNHDYSVLARRFQEIMI